MIYVSGLAVRRPYLRLRQTYLTIRHTKQILHPGGYMSKECVFCGKKPQVGNLVSHSNIKTKRRFSPNLQRVRHQFANGRVQTLTVCTRCLRSGVITKPAVRKQG